MALNQIGVEAGAVPMEQADVLAPSLVGLDDDGTVVVGWALTADGAALAAQKWIQDNRRYVEDAVVAGQPMEGLWRSITTGIRIIKGKQTVIQAFQKGWIEEIVSDSTIDYAYARVVSDDELPKSDPHGTGVGADDAEWGNPEQYILVEWEGVDPLKIDTVRSSFSSILNTDQTIEIKGEEIGTGYKILRVFANIDYESQDQDRSATVRVLYGKPRFNISHVTAAGTPREGNGYELQNMPKSIAQSVIDIYNAETGSNVSMSGVNERGLVNISIRTPDVNLSAVITDASDVVITEPGKFYTTTSYYFFNIAAPFTTPVPNALGVNDMYEASWSRSGNGLSSGVIRKTVPIAYDTGWDGYPSNGGTVYRRRFRNQTKTWLDAILAGDATYVTNTRTVSASIDSNQFSIVTPDGNDLWDGLITSSPARSLRYSWSDFPNEYWLYSIVVHTGHFKTVDPGDATKSRDTHMKRRFLIIKSFKQDDDISQLCTWARSTAEADWSGAGDDATGIASNTLIGVYGKGRSGSETGFTSLKPYDMTQPKNVGGGYYIIQKNGMMATDWEFDGDSVERFAQAVSYPDWGDKDNGP